MGCAKYVQMARFKDLKLKVILEMVTRPGHWQRQWVSSCCLTCPSFISPPGGRAEWCWCRSSTRSFEWLPWGELGRLEYELGCHNRLEDSENEQRENMTIQVQWFNLGCTSIRGKWIVKLLVSNPFPAYEICGKRAEIKDTRKDMKKSWQEVNHTSLCFEIIMLWNQHGKTSW